MKQTIVIRASDAETTITILAKIKTNGGLTRDECYTMKVRLADCLMQALPGLIYTDFNISRVMVKGT